MRVPLHSGRLSWPKEPVVWVPSASTEVDKVNIEAMRVSVCIIREARTHKQTHLKANVNVDLIHGCRRCLCLICVHRLLRCTLKGTGRIPQEPCERGCGYPNYMSAHVLSSVYLNLESGSNERFGNEDRTSIALKPETRTRPTSTSTFPFEPPLKPHSMFHMFHTE